MSISLILIGAISVVVVAGIAYLLLSKSEELTEKKKSSILLIVGTVIFVSFIVTSLKHPALHYDHSVSPHHYDLNQLFFAPNCKYAPLPKYALPDGIPAEIINEVYARNYLPGIKRSNEGQHEPEQALPQENILFLSRKDEGATHFLSQLAERTCSERHPTLYLKLQGEIRDEKDFVRAAGFHSYEQLRQSLCHLSGIEIKKTFSDTEYTTRTRAAKGPYLIIDNFEFLLDTLTLETHYEVNSFEEEDTESDLKRKKKYTTKERLIAKIVSELMNKCRTNLVLNTEDEEAIEKLYEIWEGSHQGELDFFPFEFHGWEGLRHYDIYKIVTRAIPNSDYVISKLLEANKKEEYSFSHLFTILKEVERSLDVNEKGAIKREDLHLKEANIKISVARYFNLGKAYKQARSAETKTVSFLKSRVALRDLWRLEQLNLISIRNGQVSIQ